jgi:hypothetical protein
MPDSGRPIRISLGSLRFSCEPDEAIELARQLVDAVDKCRADADKHHGGSA